MKGQLFEKYLTPIAVAVGLLLIVGALVIGSPSVEVSVKQPEAQAQASLPKDVEKFVDGNITCYVLDRWNAFRTADTAAGISCVNNK